ncbi:MAG: hypothetical protein QOF14_152 [Hyphomicrobiales bacterium]|nr:hypothetical protein [Hyphomicrobiales bacterium]
MPPTTPTDSALTWAEPPTVIAEALLELSYMLQPLRLTVVLLCAVIAPLALRSSASTQPSPSPGVFIATAREPIVTSETPSTPMKSVAMEAVADTVTVPPEVDDAVTARFFASARVNAVLKILVAFHSRPARN